MNPPRTTYLLLRRSLAVLGYMAVIAVLRCG